MKKITKEYAEKSVVELNKEITKLREDIAKTILSNKTSPVKDTNILTKKRKQLAVLMTFVSQKQQ